MFQLKDKVVYPGHGVAVVEEVIERSVSAIEVKFIKLVFLFKDMMILVPIYNIAAIGIRLPNNLLFVEEALKELYSKPEKRLETLDFTPSGWNKRNKEYQMKIQGGSLLDLIKIYRDVMHIAQIKDLSFGERTLLQNIEELIIQEIQVVKNIDREIVTQEIRSPFKQLFFHDRSFVGEVASVL